MAQEAEQERQFQGQSNQEEDVYIYMVRTFSKFMPFEFVNVTDYYCCVEKHLILTLFYHICICIL